jgi:hypothetical protein
LIVASVGLVDDETGADLNLERLYHSSGTQKRKNRFAEDENGFAMNGDRNVSDIWVEGGSRENSVEEVEPRKSPG